MRAPLRFTALGLLAALALGARSLGVASVFTPLGVIPVAPDAWYHLRRIVWGVRNFPAVLGLDGYLNFPEGARTVWTPIFDWSVAAASRLVVGTGSQAGVERFAVWVPPALAVVTVLGIYAIGRRYFSTAVGLAAAATLAVLPASVQFSRLGFVDHHVAVALASLMLLGAAMEFVTGSPRLCAAIWLGFWLAAVLLVWPGSLVHVAIIESFLAAFVLARPERAAAARSARLLAVAHGVATVVVAPLSLGNEWVAYGPFDPAVLSDFQPLFLAAAAVLWLLLAWLWARGPAGRTPATRASLAIGLGTAAVGLALLVPDLRGPVGDAFRWFGRPEQFQHYVAELQPLFLPRGVFDPRRAEMLYSRLLYAFPLLVAALAFSARRGRAPARVMLLCWWSALMLSLALLQRRFNNSFAPAYALVVGWAAVEGCRRARALLRGRGAWIAGAGAVAAAAVAIVVLGPPAVFYRAEAYGLGAYLRGEPVPPIGFAAREARLLRVGRWLRAHTPKTAGFLDPSERPEYGVLANWGDGHLLRYASERPMVQDNFLGHVGKGGRARFDLAEAYFAAADEARAVAIADELRIRYVVVSRAGSGHTPGYTLASQFAALYLRVGSAQPGYPALRHHRLIYELHPGGGYRVFERVAGARVVGRAPPAAPVEARLSLRTRLRPYEYVQRTRANAEGLYELVLPYSNEAAAGGMGIGPSWEIGSGGARASLRIAEATVLGGLRLEGPDLSGQ